jgi:hypothetical protein
MIVKKYSNRRLYDTDERYITLEELTDKIRGGTDVRVVDAKSERISRKRRSRRSSSRRRRRGCSSCRCSRS